MKPSGIARAAHRLRARLLQAFALLLGLAGAGFVWLTQGNLRALEGLTIRQLLLTALPALVCLCLAVLVWRMAGQTLRGEEGSGWPAALGGLALIGLLLFHAYGVGGPG